MTTGQVVVLILVAMLVLPLAVAAMFAPFVAHLLSIKNRSARSKGDDEQWWNP